MAKKNDNVIDSFLDTVRRWTLTYRNTLGDGTSLADISKSTSVMPLTIVSPKLKTLKEAPDIMDGTTLYYGIRYMTALSILGLHLSDGRILPMIDRLNPNRDMDTLLTSIATESSSDFFAPCTPEELAKNYRRYFGHVGLEHGVTSIKGIEASYPPTMMEEFYALEASKNGNKNYRQQAGTFINKPEEVNIRDNSNNEQNTLLVNNNHDESITFDHSDNSRRVIHEADQRTDDEKATATGSIGIKTLDGFEDAEGVTGKVFEANFQVGNSKEQVKVPILVQLDAVHVPSDVIVNLMLMNKDSIRMSSRASDALHRRIHLFWDFFLARDLLRNQKRNLLKDPTRATATLLNQKDKNRLYGMLSRNVSLNTVSAILLITEEEENDIRREIGGTLEDKTTRKIVFDNAGVMIIGVVDREARSVTYYIRDMDTRSVIPFSRFNSRNTNNSSPDMVMDMYKSMAEGRVPTF